MEPGANQQNHSNHNELQPDTSFRSALLQTQNLKNLSVLFVVALLALSAWYTVDSFSRKSIEERLERQTHTLSQHTVTRFAEFTSLLLNVRSLFLSDKVKEVDPNYLLKSFSSFVRGLEVERRHPGSLGIAFAELLPKERSGPRLDVFRKTIPNFQFRTAESDAKYIAPIALIEPMSWRNQLAIGYDMYSEPRRRAAIDKAIDTGEVQLTQPIVLKQEETTSASKQLGISMYVAAFKGGLIPETSAERWVKVLGLVYSPIRLGDFFEGLLGSPNIRKETLNFTVSLLAPDGTETEVYERFPQGVYNLSREDLAPYSTKQDIRVENLTFRIRTQALSHFINPTDTVVPQIVGLVGFILVVFLFLFLRAAQRYMRAESETRQMMEESNQKNRAHSQALKRLMRLSQNVLLQSDVNSTLHYFFETVKDLGQPDWCALYISDVEDKSQFKLYSVDGRLNYKFKNMIDREAIERSLQHVKLEHERFDIRDFTEAQQLLEGKWLAYKMTGRDAETMAFLIVGRNSDREWSPNSREILESLVAQASIGIENAILLKRANDANQAKSQFLANMSHEIRTPLGAIVGFTQIVTKERVDEKRSAQLLENIQRSSDQLSHLLNDILDLSKVEAGKLIVTHQEVELPRILMDVQSIMNLRAQNKKITFQTRIVEEIPRILIGDEVRIKQILSNIIGNAIKFTDQGEVSLRVRYQEALGRFCFEVQDTGVGIPEFSKDQLFKPFSQGDSSATRKFGGTGLGLALSKRLAEELGGSLELIWSEFGKGSIFEFCVPRGLTSSVATFNALDSETPRVLQEDSSLPSLKGRKILLVEDSEDNQEIFTYFLTKAGAQVTLAVNGQEGIQKGRAEAFDLILMDMQLPVVDGLEATRRLRLLGVSAPIVALTAHAMPEEKEKCFQAGCIGHITKPVTEESLILETYKHLGALNRELTPPGN